MNSTELKSILDAHALYLSSNFEKGECANFQNTNLGGANLRCADLRNADLRGANLRSANLRSANLRCADLRNADLRGANLEGAYLEGANLEGADLRDADLRGANLRCANLRSANLRCANLRSADLRGANLEGADLEGANLPNFQIVPEKGTFIAFKKVCNNVILELLIADSPRTSSLVGRKCRCSKATVLSATNPDGTNAPGLNFRSNHDSNFIYTVGETVEVSDYDDDIRVQCTKGIHFFMTRREAVEY